MSVYVSSNSGESMVTKLENPDLEKRDQLTALHASKYVYGACPYIERSHAVSTGPVFAQLVFGAQGDMLSNSKLRSSEPFTVSFLGVDLR